MRKVKNRKAIQNLSDKSFSANRTRNLIAVLAIALTTMLFTSLFTIGIGVVENFQRQTAMQAGGDSHAVIKSLTKEQYEKLKEHPLIKESGDCMLLADSVENEEFLKRHVELWYVPEHYYPHRFIEIIDGRAPEHADEILMDETSMILLGLEPKAGEQVTLQLRIRQADPDEAVMERTFTVCGIMKATEGVSVGFAIASEAYQDVYGEELAVTKEEASSGYTMAGAIDMDIMFSNSFGIQKKLNRVIEESGYSTDEEDEDYLRNNVNWAYVSDGVGTDMATTVALVGGLFLIMLTGYLIIYNVFQISVIKDIRYYGLLKTIGTTGRQIRRILHRQAWKMSVRGIPLGLVIGFFIGKWIVPKVLQVTSYGADGAVVSLNPFIFLGAAVFALMTVFVSVRKPAEIAAKVSPVEAVRYTDQGKKKKQKKSTDGGKLGRMALSNLGRNKKRTTIVIVSLSLAVVLLNSVFSVTSSFDMDTYLKKFITTDATIANAVYYNYGYMTTDADEIDTMNLSESFIKACEEQDGFEQGGRIYAARYQVGLDIETYKAPSYIPRDENGDLFEMYGKKKLPFGKQSDTVYEALFMGLEDVPLKEIDVWEGETDLEVIREKLKTGKYLLSMTTVDDNNFVVEEQVKHRAGDLVTLVQPDGTKREFEVLSVIKENYYSLSDRFGYNFGYCVTADVFKEMLSEDFLMSYHIEIEDEKEETYGQFLKSYTENTEPSMHYETKQYWLDSYEDMLGLIVTVGGILTFVIGIIGILNFINSVLTGIVTRQKEFAMMQAIGMTKRQLVKMLILEGIFYAGFVIVTSLLMGSIFSLTVIRAMTGGLFFLKYRFVILPMLLTFPVLLLFGIAVPWLAYRGQKKQSIIDGIRNHE